MLKSSGPGLRPLVPASDRVPQPLTLHLVVVVTMALTPGDKAGSAGAGNNQATSRAQREKRLQSDELREHIRREKLDELEQIVATREQHCVQRRYHQHKGVVPARSRNRYAEETAVPRGGDDMAD